MVISSRTPEGVPNRCPICGNSVRTEPSNPFSDAPCNHCGHLLWFASLRSELPIVQPPRNWGNRHVDEVQVIPGNVYECMFLLDTSASDNLPATISQLKTTLESNNAEVLVVRSWDERRLAYSIKGNEEGFYFLLYFGADGANLPTIEGSLRRSELIRRLLITRVDPKLVETMLSVAKFLP